MTSFDFDSCALPTYAVAAFISLVGDLGPRVFLADISVNCTREPSRPVINAKSLD